jgi:hypothetical protein
MLYKSPILVEAPSIIGGHNHYRAHTLGCRLNEAIDDPGRSSGLRDESGSLEVLVDCASFLCVY